MGLHAVILAGGRGERFWPLSRSDRPKQLLPLLGSRSLLQETAARLGGWFSPSSIWLVAGESMMPEIRRQLAGSIEDRRCIVEPAARSTAAAVAAAAAAVEAAEPGSLLLVLPADHWVPDREEFRRDVERAAVAVAEVDGLHLFGIPITRVETGYGHVQRGEELRGHPGVYRVVRFHEKPDPQKAIAYSTVPEMLWNSGIFLWKARTILDALLDHLPSIQGTLRALCDALVREKGRFGPDATRAFERFMNEAPSEPIDTAVLEKHPETFVTRASFRWSDLGGWLSWGEQVEPDRDGNRCKGRLLLRDAHDCILYSEEGALALLGVHDLIVVRLRDVTLVCSRERAQEIRDLVREARKRDDFDAFL